MSADDRLEGSYHDMNLQATIPAALWSKHIKALHVNVAIAHSVTFCYTFFQNNRP